VALPWVRLDTAFPYNPKLLAMVGEKDGHRAALVYICGLAYSGAHGTDGFLAREALPFVHGRQSDADRLVRHRFWKAQTGGWLINGWTEFQESSTEAQERRKRAQAAAQARWANNGTERLAHATRICDPHTKRRCAPLEHGRTDGRTNGDPHVQAA
jgi:hypothetical protein